jgi:hypothetical protein
VAGRILGDFGFVGSGVYIMRLVTRDDITYTDTEDGFYDKKWVRRGLKLLMVFITLGNSILLTLRYVTLTVHNDEIMINSFPESCPEWAINGCTRIAQDECHRSSSLGERGIYFLGNTTDI